MNLNKAVGYDVYAKLLTSNALENIGKWCLTSKQGVICGGAAVAVHLGKEVYQVTPDLDVLILTAAIPAVLNIFGNQDIKRNRFGFSTVVDSMETDWLIAKEGWQYEAVQNPTKWKGIAVMSLHYLIISKTVSGRDKDKHHLQLIYDRKGKQAFDLAIHRMDSLGMFADIDDLRSDMEMFELLKNHSK